MGTDIYMIAQRRDGDGWVTVPAVFDVRFTPAGYENAAYSWDVPRDYVSSAVLAGVRNEWDLPPIDEPRGYPDDFELKRGLANLGEFALAVKSAPVFWEHSISWLLVSEIVAYDWDREVIETGIVPVADWRRLKETGLPPDSYCGGVFGPDVVVVGENEVGPATTHVRMRWRIKAKDLAGGFYREILPRLLELGPPKDTRIVFGFA